MIKKIGSIIKDHIYGNKLLYISLFLFYVIGICLGAASVNDLDYQQKDEMVTFFNGFAKLLENNEFNQFSLFKISLIDNLKLVIVFWLLGFTVIGFPMYYIIIGMRGFSTGFSSGVIMGVLGTKGIYISAVCFVPKEAVLVPCLIALGINGIKLSGSLLKSWLKKSAPRDNWVKHKFLPYSIVAAFFSFFFLLATLVEGFISSGALKLIDL